MMKLLIYGIAVLSLLGANGAASAEEEKDGAKVTAAVKTWVNEWKHDVPATGRKISDNIIVLAGPAVEVEFRNRLVIEASYLMSVSDYKLTDAGITSQFDRKDLDLAVGKWINHWVGVFTGYRNSSFKEKESGTKDFSYGLFYSIRGAAPLIGSSSLYANLTYLDTRFKAEGQPREDAPGWITEIGGRTVFTKQLAMKIGYKWETTKGDVTQVKDSFRGTTLDLTYVF